MITRLVVSSVLLVVFLAVSGQGIDPEPLAALKGHKGTLSCLAFTRNGKSLVSAAKDGTVLIWDLASRKPVVQIPGHKGMIVAVAFSPDGKTIAATSHNTDVHLYDAVTGMPAGILSGHTKDVRGVAFSPDGKLIATGGVDK